MAKDKKTIPNTFENEEEAGSFWDTHSAADYWDGMKETEMEFDIGKKIHLVSIDDSLYEKIKQKAEIRHESIETYINSLIEKEVIMK